MTLPESWLEVCLADICELGSGNGAPQEDIWFEPDGNFFVRTSDVSAPREGKYIITSRDKLTDAAISNFRMRTWKKNSLLLPKSGASALLNQRALLGVDACVVAHLAILSPSTFINPEYLYWWSTTFDAARVIPDTNYPSIRLQDLGRVKLPLPTLPEQQRIVDILQQAEALGKHRSHTQTTIKSTTSEYYSQLFGDVFTNDKSWPITKLGKASDIVRGSSPRPQGDPRLFGGSVPRLMVSDLTRDGLWVDATTDSLTEEGAKSSRAMLARSVVMAVSGAPGVTAILNHDACIHDGFVGLRDLSPNLLPEFVAYTLNLLRAKNDQQAVGAVFRNLTTDQVKAITIPLPPIELQRQFQTLLFQVKTVQTDIAYSDKLLTELLDTIRIEAFSGELTASWRNDRMEEISETVIVRDIALHERGAKLATPSKIIAPPERNTSFSRPARNWLIGELSEFQFEVWNMLCHEWRGSVLADDPEIFGDFCTNPQTARGIEHFKASPNRIRRALEQLAALGLIAKVSLPKTNTLTQQTEYLTAFRPLREDENTRLTDAANLGSESGKIGAVSVIGGQPSLPSDI